MRRLENIPNQIIYAISLDILNLTQHIGVRYIKPQARIETNFTPQLESRKKAVRTIDIRH